MIYQNRLITHYVVLLLPVLPRRSRYDLPEPSHRALLEPLKRAPSHNRPLSVTFTAVCHQTSSKKSHPTYSASLKRYSHSRVLWGKANPYSSPETTCLNGVTLVYAKIDRTRYGGRPSRRRLNRVKLVCAKISTEHIATSS